MLDPWITSRGRTKKAAARLVYERASWGRAFAFHALSQHEAGSIAAEHAAARTIVIPNPGPAAQPLGTAPRRPIIAFLSRIHPKKNLLALIDAWTRLDPQDGAELIIAGWGDAGHVAEVEAALAAAPPSARFIGAAYGADKQRLLDQARFLILPTFSEGLPMAILEAWAANTPTIMTDDCNLPEGFAAGAAMRCGHDPGSIARALEQALAADQDNWNAMARAAHGLASGPFSRTAVAGQWRDAYQAALDGSYGRPAAAAS